MTTCLGMSCSFGLLCMSFVNVYQFVFLLIAYAYLTSCYLAVSCCIITPKYEYDEGI